MWWGGIGPSRTRPTAARNATGAPPGPERCLGHPARGDGPVSWYASTKINAGSSLEDVVNRLTDKTMKQIGIILIVAGVVLGMGVSSIPSISMGLQVGLLVLALAFFAGGLFAIIRSRPEDSERP